jgi:hypothetical protein
VGGITGGAAGAGEGPTMNFGGVQNLTNNMYVGDVPIPIPKVLSQQQQGEPGSRVTQISCVKYF